MKNYIPFIILCLIAFGGVAHAQTYNAIDNSDVAITQTTNESIGNIQADQIAHQNNIIAYQTEQASWDNKYGALINQEQSAIANDQAIIDNAALAGVQQADTIASPSVQAQINAMPAKGLQTQGTVSSMQGG